MVLRIDAAIAELAERQHGLFTREQLIRIGVGATVLERRLSCGLWQRAGRSVYRLAGAPDSWHGNVMRAVLVSGAGSAASHSTAAYLHGLIQRRPEKIEVVGPRGRRRAETFVLHQSLDLVPDHITEINGIAVTTIERTIVDVGVPAGIGATARCVDEARRQSLVRLEDVATLLHEVGRRGRNGVGPARRILEERLAWDHVTESQLEDRFLRLLQRAGVPRPIAQFEVRDPAGELTARVDFAYPDRLLAIELDGVAYHSDRQTFQRDRQRQNRLTLSGWTVIRFTYWDVFAGGDWVIDNVETALGPKLGNPTPENGV